MQLAHQIKIVSVFSCYGNSILYNEIVEIGGYTIQLYYKLNNHSGVIAIKILGFLYTSQWVVYNFCTPKWVTQSFSMVGCKYSNTYNFSL